MEDYNKTVSLFIEMSHNKNIENIDRICSEKFIKSNSFSLLKKYIISFSFNFSNTNEIVYKEFIINDNSKNRLVLAFSKRSNNFWYISDAYMENHGIRLEFDEHGFAPLAIEYNFSDFLKAIKSNEISNFYGLAPFGKVNAHFILQNKITKTEDSKLFIKNIICSQNDSSLVFFYFQIIYQPNQKGNKRGWLIDDFKEMKYFYSQNYPNDAYFNYLSGNINGINLSDSNNKYFYSNIKKLDIIKGKNIGIGDKVKIAVVESSLRELPTANSKIKFKVFKDEMGIVLEKSTEEISIKSDGGSFVRDFKYKIEINGMIGWIFGKDISIINQP